MWSMRYLSRKDPKIVCVCVQEHLLFVSTNVLKNDEIYIWFRISSDSG